MTVPQLRTEHRHGVGIRRGIPLAGCLTVWLMLTLICLMPLFLAEALRTALSRLHLAPEVAILVVIGLFVGSLINIPVRRIESRVQVPTLVPDVFGLGWMFPRWQRVTTETVIAVNAGGCLIPVGLVVWELLHMLQASEPILGTAVMIAAVNVIVCHRVAVPISGVGIMMPGFVSPLVSLSLTWLLLPPESLWRAPVAFVAGVCGPLIGADVLNLRRISTLSTGMLSIGGAGTFDGIVLSGLLAAFFA